MLSRSEQVDEFFVVAVNLDPAARETFLESLTSDVREDVERLLAAYEGVSSVKERPRLSACVYRG